MQDHGVLARLKACLEQGNLPISDATLAADVRANVRLADLNLLTLKQQIYLLNGTPADVPPALLLKIKSFGADYYLMKAISLANLQWMLPKIVLKVLAISIRVMA